MTEETRRAEAAGDTLGEAKWAALKELERSHPGVTGNDVEFAVIEEGDTESGVPARVAAVIAEARVLESVEELPDEPAERVRALLARVALALGLRASVEVEETDEEIRATVNGEDLGILIGKHGATIDSLQHLVTRAAFKGRPGRKPVVLDAAGYRERREAALQRAADQAVEDALSYGRAVELEPMSSPERRVVHTYLRDRTDIQTHSEGDEPERRLVVTPLRPRS